MKRMTIIVFLVFAAIFNAADATWVSQRPCDQYNNTFGAALIQNGNCVPDTDIEDEYVLYTCSSDRFVILQCSDSACNRCKLKENYPLNQCTPYFSSPYGSSIFQCFQDGKIDYGKVINSSNYLLQTFSYGNRRCNNPTQTYVSPVGTCFLTDNLTGRFINCNAEAHFSQFSGPTCTGNPSQKYQSLLNQCVSDNSKVSEYLKCIMSE